MLCPVYLHEEDDKWCLEDSLRGCPTLRGNLDPVAEKKKS